MTHILYSLQHLCYVPLSPSFLDSQANDRLRLLPCQLPCDPRAVVELLHIFLLYTDWHYYFIRGELDLRTPSRFRSVDICCNLKNFSLTSPNAVCEDKYVVTALKSLSKRIAPSCLGCQLLTKPRRTKYNITSVNLSDTTNFSHGRTMISNVRLKNLR